MTADDLIKEALYSEGVVLSGEPGSKRLITLALQYGFKEAGEPEDTPKAVIHHLVDPKSGNELQVRRHKAKDQIVWQHMQTNDLGTDPEHMSQVLRSATRNTRTL